MKTQKILSIYCPYCCSIKYTISESDKLDVGEEIRCDVCKRKFKLSDLPLNYEGGGGALCR